MTNKIDLATYFKIGDSVEYVSKVGKDYGIVTGLTIRGSNNLVSYLVTWSDKEEKPHYDFELRLQDGAK